jgi:glycosyltransferase-like protein
MRDDSALRVALLTHSVNPRGGVVHTLELANALHDAGLEVTVMAPAAPKQRLFRAVPCAVDLIELEPHEPGTMEVVRARIDAYVDHLTTIRGSQRIVDQFDVLHAQDGIGGNALATLRERGLIHGFMRTVHHVDSHEDARIGALQERGILGACRVLCVSEVWRRQLQLDYGVAASVIGNGVNLQRFSAEAQPADARVAERLGLLPDAPLVVSVGGIEERKNTVRILQAFSMLRNRFPHAQLAIVGGASLLDHTRYRSDFDRAVAASGLATGPGKNIVITGTLLDAELPAVLRCANAVAYPSLTEGFGLVVLESLACGIPTVVSRMAPFTEYLSDRDVQWADPLDSTSIADALCAALATRKFARPAVCERLSWAASAAQHIAVYRQFAAGDRLTLH